MKITFKYAVMKDVFEFNQTLCNLSLGSISADWKPRPLK